MQVEDEQIDSTAVVKRASATASNIDKESMNIPSQASVLIDQSQQMTFEANHFNGLPESTKKVKETKPQLKQKDVVEKVSVTPEKKKKEPKMTKINAAQARSEKYYKQFDFFFNRSCFRIMTEFYKEKFNKFYASEMILLKKEQPGQWKQKQKLGGLTATTKVEMDSLIEKFIISTFGANIIRPSARVGYLERKQMVNSMMMIVFSHRYSKGDVFINEALESEDAHMVDFTIVRDVMYKYSKKAQERYLAHPIEAFLFAAFSLSDEGLLFLKNKPDNKGDQSKLEKLQVDLADLKNQAI